MSDIATLGLAIDSRQVVTAKTALDQFAQSGGKAAQGATAFKQAAEQAAKSTGLARFELINLSRQVQDVGVSLASGQSPFMVLAQQGTQIADIFSSSKTATVGGAIKQVTSGIANFITPIRALAGGVALAGTAAYVAYSSWKTFALQIDDTARSVDTTVASLSRLQGAAAVKGISADDFTKGIQSFGQQVYMARNNMGQLAEVFRANNTRASDFDGYMEKAADLIKNAGSDQQRLVLLQQMGLPATMEWVRLLSGGAEGLKKAKEAATEFATDDGMVRKAREFDEAWNRTWNNFTMGAKSAIVTVNGWLDQAIQKGRQGLMAVGVDVAGNLLRNGQGTPLQQSGFEDFYRATGAKRVDDSGNKQSVDKDAIQRAIALEQQRLGILGQTASVGQQVRAVELQIQQARLAGVNITAQEADNLKRIAEQQALGTLQMKMQADAYRVEADTVGMSVGQATAYAAAQNAINEARRMGRTLSDSNIAAIRTEADALGKAAQQADNMRWAYSNLVQGPLQTFRQELSNGATFFDALKKAGVSALDAISSKLMDMVAQNLFTSAFGGSGGGGGILSSLGSIFGGVHHGGYGPGDSFPTRAVPAAVFARAPRFHSGIGPGERAAVIRNDESVLTPGQMKQLAPTGGAQQTHVTVGVTVDDAGNLQAYVKDVSQAAAANTLKDYVSSPQFVQHVGVASSRAKSRRII